MTRYVLPAVILFALSSCKTNTNFELVDSSRSGIHFNNLLQSTDSMNVLDVENIYNGGGVGIGDFNNDGLPDIYFTGNIVPNKLYLNKGDMQFTDITAQSRVTGEGHWGRGVSIVDINNDGLSDIYVCASLSADSKKRENILYVNQGAGADGVPVFTNMAAAYGLDDTAHSTMAAFFDYDNDGDLDMYLLINEIVKHESPNTFRPQYKNREHANTDKLFRNDYNDSLKHGVYTDISMEAGITLEGYGHGVNIVDINRDGWKDIYVTNDFLSQNLLYINQRNGSFKNEAASYFKHTAENAMGQDVIDINNDGLADIIELDMNPEDNFRKKMMMNPIGYQRYSNNDYYNYQYQYVRNVLQLNQGPMVKQDDSVGHPVFSDISFFAGVAETDWSWSPSVADFDNDGFRDIIITNGFPKDVTDHDFMAFRNNAAALSVKKDILTQIPEVKISNYAYRNNGDLSFTNVTKSWGMESAGFSNGAAYADLDNDGDLDYVINNINDEASVYKNNTREQFADSSNYINISFAGSGMNRNALGAWVELYFADGQKQFYENTPYRGYLSSITGQAHFGLGKKAVIDSLVVKWPAGRMQILRQVKANQTLQLRQQDAQTNYSFERDSIATGSLFREVTSRRGINYKHQDQDFIDFNIQNLLPHKLSEYGPALAVGDVDGNGLDDFISGGSFFFAAQVFLQQANGSFKQQQIAYSGIAQKDSQSVSSGPPAAVSAAPKNAEDMGVSLFDADGDGDLDLYIARGGYESPANAVAYKDLFCVNDGKGNFAINSTAFPVNLTSKSCVRAADYDHDGDLDLFMAGRVEPGKYPRSVSSFIYRNDSKNGSIAFTDVSKSVAGSLEKAGLICDALFTDFDNDGWQDLLLMGEWAPVSFLKNNKGIFQDVSAGAWPGAISGWWNSVTPGDFDNDGDIDYVVGNFGTNSLYKPSAEFPVFITANDFDNNGSFDAIPSFFLPQSFSDPARREVPVHLRDDLIKQVVKNRAKFRTYKEFANACLQDVLSPGQIDSALRLSVTDLHSYILQNDGKGKFNATPLPSAAQISILNGMVAEDFDGDGNLDLVAGGNDFGTDLAMGKYDALNGLYLKGDGKGGFTPLSILQSGVYLPGNTKALVKLRSADNHLIIVASENRGPLKLLEQKAAVKLIPVLADDVSAILKMRDGRSRKTELNYGASFLSQSGRFIVGNNNVTTAIITNNRGQQRTIAIQ